MKKISERIERVPRSTIREIFDLAQDVPGVISLGIGEPSFKTPIFIQRAAKKAINSFNRYTVNVGLAELRDEISKKLRRENAIKADPKREIIVTAGATQAIFLAISCLLEANDQVLIPAPIFGAYQYSAELAGANAVEVPLKQENAYRFEKREFQKYLTKHTKIIVLNSPCNPTGVVYSRSEIDDLVEFAAEHDLYIISDEIYEKYLYNGVKHYSPASKDEFRDRVITINGFSKTFAMTGWRLGYAVASEKIIGAMTKFNMYDAVCANVIAQKAGIVALRSSFAFFDPLLERYDEARKLICKYLDEMSLPYVKPDGAFYVFPDISSLSNNSMDYCKKLLLQNRVSTVPGSSFGLCGESHIRLSYSLSEDKLARAMEKMKKFNQRYRG